MMQQIPEAISVNTVLGAVSTVLLLFVGKVLTGVWSEIKSLRDSRHDHATLLASHDVKLEVHEKELDEIKARVFDGGEK